MQVGRLSPPRVAAVLLVSPSAGSGGKHSFNSEGADHCRAPEPLSGGLSQRVPRGMSRAKQLDCGGLKPGHGGAWWLSG